MSGFWYIRANPMSENSTEAAQARRFKNIVFILSISDIKSPSPIMGFNFLKDKKDSYPENFILYKNMGQLISH